MPRITFTLPPSESSIAQQLVDAISTMPVTQVGPVNGRIVTLAGERHYLVAVLSRLHPGRGYKVAHELAAEIEDST